MMEFLLTRGSVSTRQVVHPPLVSAALLPASGKSSVSISQSQPISLLSGIHLQSTVVHHATRRDDTLLHPLLQLGRSAVMCNDSTPLLHETEQTLH